MPFSPATVQSLVPFLFWFQRLAPTASSSTLRFNVQPTCLSVINDAFGTD